MVSGRWSGPAGEVRPPPKERRAADALRRRFGDYKRWRDEVIVVISNYHSWLQEQGLVSGEDDLRIFELIETLKADKLMIAMVGEFSRGKTELINAIFFADYRRRLLPTEAGRTTMCPTELIYDETRPPGISLLPIETRSSSQTIAEYKRSPTYWTTLPLELDDPDKMSETFKEIIRTQEVSADAARQLGFWNPDVPEAGPQVRIPVWRHAVVNYPHPLLKQGLSVLDTPGLNSLGNEPELTMSMLPSANIVLFVLSADTGVTKSDLQVWREHVCVAKGHRSSERMVVLNKIDALADELRSAEAVQASISRQTQETAAALGISKNQVLAVSAQQGLIGKVKHDAQLVERSGLLVLERRLSEEIIPQKQALLRDQIVREIGDIIERTKATIAARLTVATTELEELRGMTGKSQDQILETIDKLRHDKEAYDKKVREADVTHRLVGEEVKRLMEYLSMPAFDELIGRTRKDMKDSWTTHGLKVGMKTFFDGSRATMKNVYRQAVVVKELMEQIYQKFQIEHGLARIKLEGLALKPFVKELKRLHYEAEMFRGSAVMLMTEQHFVIKKFFITLVSRARQVFDECNLAATRWCRGIMAPISAQIREHKALMDQRLRNLKEIHRNLDSLHTRIEYLSAAKAKLEIQQQMTAEVLAKIHQPIDGSEPAGVRSVA